MSRSSSTSTPAPPALSAQTFQSSLKTLSANYNKTTPPKIKVIDAFLLMLVVSGVLQMAYRIVVTSYPFNAFLGGFGGTVGQFVLLTGLRFQLSPLPTDPTSTVAAEAVKQDETGGDSTGGVVRRQETKDRIVQPERAFAEFCAASIVLHVFMYNFLG